MEDQRSYLMRIQREHLEILDCIRKRAPASARAAMRRHLTNSRRRYQKLKAALDDGPQAADASS
jgi:DNA-binding FadR family transcriptional regulator